MKNYEIIGNDLQMVKIYLKPNESVKSQEGAMNYMSSGIVMETKILDKNNGGFFSKLGHTLKRVIAGESLSMVYYTNESDKEEVIAFSGEVAGQIVPIKLNDEEFTVQQGAYLCSEKNIDITFDMQKVKTGLFGGESFIMQKLKGSGLVFINAGGFVEKIELNNETIKVETGSLVGFSSEITYDVEFVKGFKNILFSGQGLALTTLSGTGIVYIQSMPFGRFANKIYQALAPKFNNDNGSESFDIFDE